MKTIQIIFITLGILLQSCITIKQSSLRVPNSEKIEIGNCKISSSGAIYMNIFGIIKTDFIPASTKIEFRDLTLYTDPLVIDDTSKADYIFITHNHPDHFSKSMIDQLTIPETIIIGPKTVTKKLKHYNTKTISIGDKVDFGDIKCEVVESYNLNSSMHKKGSNFVGYLISCDTINIYVAGDTDFIPEMKELKDITVAIIPIGEGKTAMNPQTAAEAVNLIKPKVVIPIHYELEQNREKEFLELVNEGIEVKYFQKIEK